MSTNKAEFLLSGERHIADILGRAGMDDIGGRKGRALDFGCGVGRLLIPLSTRFEDVVGVDVSTPMLEEAERNAERNQISNLTLVRSIENVAADGPVYDFVNSYLVFQHIPRLRGMAIMRDLIALVRTGGTLSLHICVSDMGDVGSKILKTMRRFIPGMRQAVNVYKARPMFEPPMEMNSYDLVAVLRLLSDAGFASPQIDIEEHGCFLTANIIVRRGRVPG